MKVWVNKLYISSKAVNFFGENLFVKIKLPSYFILNPISRIMNFKKVRKISVSQRQYFSLIIVRKSLHLHHSKWLHNILRENFKEHVKHAIQAKFWQIEIFDQRWPPIGCLVVLLVSISSLLCPCIFSIPKVRQWNLQYLIKGKL